MPLSPDIHIDRSWLENFCQRWQVEELSWFGSAIREDFGPESDVDVLVRFSTDAHWSAWDVLDMKAELEAYVGRNVDIVEPDAIRNPYRKAAILGNKEIAYDRAQG